MAEYWVSKKQYWCKYCNIWVRDDAPSRRLHETGLKHQGSKERFIRDLYKTGNMAKREKEESAREMARIEAAAARSHAADLRSHGVTGTAAQAPRLHSSAFAKQPSASSSKSQGDKWSNYSTAEQLGLAESEETTTESSYEIEQMVRGRTTAVGKWEEVPDPSAGGSGSGGAGWTGPVGRVGTEEEEESENWKLGHGQKVGNGKRAVRDVYDDDDWDPAAALGAVRAKLGKAEGGAGAAKGDLDDGKGLKREGWSGKLELGLPRKVGTSGEGEKGSESVKKEAEAELKNERDVESEEPKAVVGADVKPDLGSEQPGSESKDLVTNQTNGASLEGEAEVKEETAGSSLFKKRRPPPGGRKK